MPSRPASSTSGAVLTADAGASSAPRARAYSGFGKDMSMYALEEYTAIKHVVFELTGAPRKDWYDAVSSR